MSHDPDHALATAEPTGGDDHGHGGTMQYLVVFVLLCVLTGASFFTYSDAWPFKDTPSIGWAFMMAVSCTKALLVMLFFMHLLWEANWKYVLTVPAATMSLFLILMLVPDVGLRMRRYSEERWQYAADVPLPHVASETSEAGHGAAESLGKEEVVH